MTHGWHSKEMMFGNYYVDGFAIVDGRRIIYEYNGCAYHSCERCRPVRVNENEDARKAYFKSLPNTKIVEIASCEWYSDKCEMNLNALKSEISPLLYKKIVSMGEIMRLVAKKQIYGFAVVDLEKSPSAKKWARLNYPPIMQKNEIYLEDLPEWMQDLYEPEELPKTTIVQTMHAKELLLHTELLRFYMENGFYVTKLHKFFEYQASPCFENVYRKVYEARVDATKIATDENSTPEMKDSAERKATAVKLVSNSMYGSLLLVRFNHRRRHCDRQYMFDNVNVHYNVDVDVVDFFIVST